MPTDTIRCGDDMSIARSALNRFSAAQWAYRHAVHGRLVVERNVLSVMPRPAAPGGRILAYHSIGNPAWGVNDVRPADFERHLRIAADDGWEFGTPEQVLADPARRMLAITFDDGDRTVATVAAPVLRAHGIPATLFVVTGWADGDRPDGHDQVLNWAEIDRLQADGMQIASHSVSHLDFGTLDPGQVRQEIEVAAERLEAVLGIEPDEFAIPFGQSRNWTDTAERCARAAGYRRVYAQAVDTRPAGTVPRTFVTRIDRPRLFRAALAGRFDRWEEWY